MLILVIVTNDTTQNGQRPRNRKMTMILKIEKANDKNNALIKNNADILIAECKELYQPKIDGMKTDDYREWLFANHSKMASYLYDELGEPNKKTGERKPIMGQHKKNIFNNGIKEIATNETGFLAWCESDHGQGTSSLAKVKPAITAFQKSLEPKQEKQSGASDETGENETGESETIAKPPLEQVAQELLKRFTPDECVKLSEMLYDMACENASDEAIEKVA